jgi:hypothetical protein
MSVVTLRLSPQRCDDLGPNLSLGSFDGTVDVA